MPVILQTSGLRILSNIFMAFAWYAHLKISTIKNGGLPRYKLGNRSVRVFVAGARKSHRLHTFQRVATQDPAGSDHTIGICPVRRVHYAATSKPRLSLGGVVSTRRRLFYVPQLTIYCIP